MEVTQFHLNQENVLYKNVYIIVDVHQNNVFANQIIIDIPILNLWPELVSFVVNLYTDSFYLKTVIFVFITVKFYYFCAKYSYFCTKYC